ncbi:hypothetical protein [Sinorhizobium numidicum]|uniref:hypothetical protein n=1 Tax=Sinorhizobium numidicum TaxID=680248 RepID=UPI003CC87D18
MIAQISRAAGGDLKVRSFLRWLLAIASPFVPFFNELREMRYLWREGLEMRNDRLIKLLGEEPHTPIDQAVSTTLASLGCRPPKPVPQLSAAAVA